jgi:NodT family efflux transporter outer membrane factor (OMF) lipoprotein
LALLKGWWLCLIVASAVCGCAVSPEHAPVPTAAHEAERYHNAPRGQKADPEEVDQHMAQWWRHLQDPLLERYVAELRRDNLDLKQAAARLEQAWAQQAMHAGSRFPSLSAAASANRSFRPSQELDTLFGGGGPFPGGGGDTQRVYDTSIETNLQLSWQVDVFGRLRNRAAASRARAEAVRGEGEALLHTLVAQLARHRIAISALKEQLALSRKMVRSRRRTLEVVRLRYEQGAGDVSAGDVHLARESLSSAKADIPDLKQQLQSRAYAVDILLGNRPGATRPLSRTMPLERAPGAAPVGLPAGLLDRRPDLRSAELRIMAEQKDVGVAVADLFPDLTLSGRLGFEHDTANELLTPDRMLGSILSELMLRLFQGGRLRARVRLEEAQAREASLSYAQQVLEAMREVEQSLSRERRLAARIPEVQAAAASSRRAEELSLDRYRRGLTPLLQVLQAQRRRYAAELRLINAYQARWNARVDLYLALGGDWTSGGAQGGNNKGDSA